WRVVASLAGNETSLQLSNLASAQYYFRARAMYPGQIGLYVTAPGNVISVLVDPRSKVDITKLVKTAISNVSLVGGVFQLDLNIANQSSNTYVPLTEFKIVNITSGSGTVAVINADNSGNGTNVGNAALFDYSRQLGPDDQFSPAEVTGNRTIKFQDNASELFTFKAVVTAYQRIGGGSAGDPAAGGSSPAGSSGTSTSLEGLTSLLQFTVNPVLKTVAVSIVQITP